MSRASRPLTLLALLATVLAACQPSVPASLPTTSPQVSAAPTGDATATAELSTVGPTLTPTSGAVDAPGIRAGDVLLEETHLLSAGGGPVALTFLSPEMQPVRIDVTGLGGAAGYALQLSDMFGNMLASFEADGSQTAESVDEITLPYAGEYRLTLTPQNGSASLQVSVTALGTPSGGAALGGVGESGSGELAGERVTHAYTLPLNQGEAVTFEAAAGDDVADIRLTLHGPDGRELTRAEGVLAGFVTPQTGEYVLLVGSLGRTSGEYTLQVRPANQPAEAAGEPDIVTGRVYRAMLVGGSPLLLTFDGQVGDALRVEVLEPAEELDVDLRVTSPFGKVIAYAMQGEAGQGERIAEMQLPYDGRYGLELTPYGSGEASFRLSPLEESALTGGGVFGTAGTGARTGRIAEQGVFHYYQFEASAGETVTLRVSSETTTGELDLGLALMAPDGQQVIFADDSPGAERPSDPQLIAYELAQTGTYTAVVYSFTDGTGVYDLQYERQE